MDSILPVVQGDVDENGRAQPPGAATSAVVSDVHPAGEDTVQQPPRRLPDVFNPEWQREGMPDTAFNRKYPPDAWGEEAAPNARVWKIYRDVQEAAHNGMLDGWNKTLDVLLIFAGLFSAVLTAFLIESYKSLQPDYTQYVASFLYAAAVSNNHSGGVFPALDTLVAPDRFVQTSAAQRWTNGLWYSSLVISLAVALLCILIKQWLDIYDSHVSSAAPSPIHWARRHNLYHRGLNRWGLPGLISFLPLLLHVSVFLFFVGLILFLRPLDSAIAYSLLVMVSCIATFYILSFVLPAWRLECPSYTPLLAQIQLLVSRSISGLRYVIERLHSWACDLIPTHAGHALSDLAQRMGEWLESIQLRESHTISTCAQELDGYVLSALIDLPTDTNPDVVYAACVALGAVTSTCTMGLISPNIPDNSCINKIRYCYRLIPSTTTGFAIASREKLRRAYYAMWAEDRLREPLRGSQEDPPRLRSSLGIDELLINTLDDEMPEEGCIDLIPHLQSLSLTADSSPGFPLRSTCLTFMNQYAQCYPWYSQWFPCFLLVFCAGRFADADRHELVRALRSVETVLRGQGFIRLSAHNGGEQEYITAVVNALWLMLVRPELYNVDTLTAQIVAYHAYEVFPPIHPVWAHLSGLSAFCRSPTFGQCVSTRDRLANYRSFVNYPRLAGCSESQVTEYWLCFATILRLSWDAPRSEGSEYLYWAERILPIRGIDWRVMPRSLGPYATLDDLCEPALSALLDGPNAIATWVGASSSSSENKSIRNLAILVHRISIVLCRRQRLGRANDAFILGFFSGTFLLACFRYLMSGESDWEWVGHLSVAKCILDLARHCLKLSPAGFLEICTQLEETGDAGSDLRAHAVTFAQRLRDGSMPGGELSGECGPHCPCMIEHDRSLATRVWHYLVGRFRQLRNGSSTSSNV